MEPRSALTILARQIEAAKIHLDLHGRRADAEGVAGPVLRTLRVTYLAFSSGLDPCKDAAHLFILKVNSTGDHCLTQGGLPVPVNAPYLAYLFWTAGVELLPGQTLFLEPELAKHSVEEALGVLAVEQAHLERECQWRRDDPDALRQLELRSTWVWERKIELVAASLLADEDMERSRALAGPEEAA